MIGNKNGASLLMPRSCKVRIPSVQHDVHLSYRRHFHDFQGLAIAEDRPYRRLPGAMLGGRFHTFTNWFPKSSVCHAVWFGGSTQGIPRYCGGNSRELVLDPP